MPSSSTLPSRRTGNWPIPLLHDHSRHRHTLLCLQNRLPRKHVLMPEPTSHRRQNAPYRRIEDVMFSPLVLETFHESFAYLTARSMLIPRRAKQQMDCLSVGTHSTVNPQQVFGKRSMTRMGAHPGESVSRSSWMIRRPAVVAQTDKGVLIDDENRTKSLCSGQFGGKRFKIRTSELLVQRLGVCMEKTDATSDKMRSERPLGQAEHDGRIKITGKALGDWHLRFLSCSHGPCTLLNSRLVPLLLTRYPVREPGARAICTRPEGGFFRKAAVQDPQCLQSNPLRVSPIRMSITHLKLPYVHTGQESDSDSTPTIVTLFKFSM